MDTVDRVGTAMDALQLGDFDTLYSLLAPDFVFSGPVPQPLDANQWLDVSAILQTAFPDLNYNFSIDDVDGDTVSISAALSGTHTGDLDLRMMGMGVVPPTGKTVAIGRDYGVVTVYDGKIVSWEINANPETGLRGILSQLGIRMPAG